MTNRSIVLLTTENKNIRKLESTIGESGYGSRYLPPAWGRSTIWANSKEYICPNKVVTEVAVNE